MVLAHNSVIVFYYFFVQFRRFPEVLEISRAGFVRKPINANPSRFSTRSLRMVYKAHFNLMVKKSPRQN